MLGSIPVLEPGCVGNYIQAINAAMIQGALAASTGKILLYGAQLYLAAVPQHPPAALPDHTNQLIERSTIDRRFKRRNPKKELDK